MKRMKYINIPEDRITLAVPPKCGSSSVYASLQKHFSVPGEAGPRQLVNCQRVRLLKADLVPHRHKIVFVLRHPLDRFRSLWRNKCRDGGKLAAAADVLYGMSPEELFEFIQEYGNHHWTRQASMADTMPFGAEIEFVPLERLSIWWADNTEYPPLEVRNETIDPLNPVISDELEAKILDWYADDLRMWCTTSKQENRHD